MSDSKKLLQFDLMDHTSIVYTRPFLYQFLHYVRCVNKHNILIMWTAATRPYIYQNLLLCNIGHYFHHILTFSDCNESESKYGAKKAYSYVIDKYPQYANMRSVIIDDLAVRNTRSDQKTYSRIYSLLPYTLRTVVQTYGAFNVDPIFIRDVDIFIRTKGLFGIARHQDDNNNYNDLDPLCPQYGDTVLLSLIELLDKDFFEDDDNDVTTDSDYDRFPKSYIVASSKSDHSHLQPLLWVKIDDDEDEDD